MQVLVNGPGLLRVYELYWRKFMVLQDYHSAPISYITLFISHSTVLILLGTPILSGHTVQVVWFIKVFLLKKYISNYYFFFDKSLHFLLFIFFIFTLFHINLWVIIFISIFYFTHRMEYYYCQTKTGRYFFGSFSAWNYVMVFPI